MAQTIKIKRSTSTATPTSLEAGELAYSFKSGSKKLFIGDTSNNVIAIGGETVFGLAEGALQRSGGTMTGNITMSSTETVDGRDLSVDGSKLDGIESGADVTDATNVNAAGAVMNSDTSTASMSFVKDEDNMSSNSATHVATQQSIKTYVDTEIGALNTGVTGVSGTAPIVSSGGASPAISISLDDVTVEKNTSNNKLQAKTAAIADGGTALATADQIHTFVTGQSYITLTTLSNATNVNFSQLTFTGSTIKSAETMTLDPATHGDETGTVVIEGDLTVKGTTTTVNSTTVEIGDNILKLNKDYSGSAPSADAGLEIERGTQTNAFIVWDESADRWSVDPGTGTLSPLNVENVAINGGTF